MLLYYVKRAFLSVLIKQLTQIAIMPHHSRVAQQHGQGELRFSFSLCIVRMPESEKLSLGALRDASTYMYINIQTI